jgi:predicted ATP-grasp superfamily ATP-dependent carboligase
VEKPAVLVTAARTRAAYAIIASLAREGVPVYAADSTARSMSFLSRYVKGRFVYPSPFREPDRFVEFLQRIGADHRISVLIPAMEETYTIAKNRDLLGRHYKMALADYGQLIHLHDKGRWVKLASAQNVALPRTYDLERVAKTPSLMNAMRFPVLVKPKQGGGGWAVREVGSREILAGIVDSDNYEGTPFRLFNVQEKIDGETICVAMLYNQGKRIAKLAYEQLRNYPRPFGQATLRRTIRNDAAESCFERLLDAIGWHGVCQGDFLLDRSTGQPYLVDINPRFWGSTALAVAADVDFPYLVYRTALGEPVTPVDSFSPNVYCRWLGGDLAALASQLWSSGPKGSTLREILGPRASRIGYDDFSLRDPLPLLGWCVDVLFTAIRAKTLGSAPHDASQDVWK